LELSGRTTTVGEAFPREVGDAFETVPEIPGSSDPISTLDEPDVSDVEENSEPVACLASSMDLEEAAASDVDVKVALNASFE